MSGTSQLQLNVSSGFLIFFDNVRVDQHVLNFSTSVSNSGDYGSATISMRYVPDLDFITHSENSGQIMNYVIADALKEDAGKFYITDGVENMTAVRIFVKNGFSGHYCQVFEGNIRAKSISVGANERSITFYAYDYMNWLNRLICPWSIPMSSVSPSTSQQVQWSAHGIDVESAQTVITSANEQDSKNITIHEAIRRALGYTFINNSFVNEENSVLSWDKALGRMMLMGDIAEGLNTEDVIFGYKVTADALHSDSFYMKLKQILGSLLFEFYQDRDGIIRIKPCFWNQDVIKSFVIDSSLIEGFRDSVNWNNFYTRVVATGTQFAQQFSEGLTVTGPQMAPVAVATFNGGMVATSPPIEGYSDSKISTVTASHMPFDITMPYRGDVLMTSSFNEQRGSHYHKGVDFVGQHGKEVYSIFEGVVTRAGSGTGGEGNYILIRNSQGYVAQYYHLSKILVSAGASIPINSIIGIEGSTGNSSGSHLHLGILDPKGQYVDPAYALRINSLISESDKTGMKNEKYLYLKRSAIEKAMQSNAPGDFRMIEAQQAEKDAAKTKTPTMSDFKQMEYAEEAETNRQKQVDEYLAKGTSPTIYYDQDTVKNSEFLLKMNKLEQRYGPLVHNVHQPFIKMQNVDSYNFSGVKTKGDAAAASEALVKYANFTLNLLNAGMNTASLSTSVAMPWLRPGLNAWVDPSSIDKIYYIDSVSHSGNPTSGVTTSLSMSMGRSSRNFVNGTLAFGGRTDSVSDDIFINRIMYGPETFGKTLGVSDYDAMRKRMIKVHSGQSSSDDINNPIFKELYGATGNTINWYHSRPDHLVEKEYVYPVFDQEYGAKEIQNTLDKYYQTAPEVIKSRSSRLKTILKNSEKSMKFIYGG